MRPRSTFAFVMLAFCCVGSGNFSVAVLPILPVEFELDTARDATANEGIDSRKNSVKKKTMCAKKSLR